MKGYRLSRRSHGARRTRTLWEVPAYERGIRAVRYSALWGTNVGKAALVGATSFELRGSLVVVRDLVEEDEAAFIEWAGHPEMYRYMIWRHESAEAAAASFHRLLNHPERTATNRRRWFLAVVNSRRAFCGFAGFDVLRDEAGEFGWYLAPQFWDRGYATEMSALFLEFGFETLRLSSVQATCDPANLASPDRVLEKSGLSFSGEETVDTWQGERQRLRFIITADEWRRSQQL